MFKSTETVLETLCVWTVLSIVGVVFVCNNQGSGYLVFEYSKFQQMFLNNSLFCLIIFPSLSFFLPSCGVMLYLLMGVAQHNISFPF